jgi:hypothetical protein
MIRERYHCANKKTRTKILDELCENFKYNRKYAIALLNQPMKKPSKRPGPKSIYNKDVILEPLKKIFLASGQMCSKKLKVAIPLWLPHYEKEYGALTDDIKQKLYKMSPATIDRLLKPFRITKGKCTTKPGLLNKSKIPLEINHWDDNRPGFIEADTVALCGNSLRIDFVWTITYTDIFSTWTEIRATRNKGAAGILTQTKDVEDSLVFPILGFHSDNGLEFLNTRLISYFQQREKPVQFTRGRPYHKNDNAHVEQKNWTHVRQIFGYDRFDDLRLVDLMNDLLRHEWSWYQNHFCPSMKLQSKSRVGSKYKKIYDTPQTPYQRLMKSEHVSNEAKIKLSSIHLKLNPFELKRVIEQKLNKIFQLAWVRRNMRQCS